MGKECSIEEVLKLPHVKDELDELSLELSLGGSYEKLEKKLRKIEGKRYPFEENGNGFPRSDYFSCGGELNRREFVDLQNKGVNVEDKLLLEKNREKDLSLGLFYVYENKREQQMQRLKIGNGFSNSTWVGPDVDVMNGSLSGISKVLSNGSLERTSSAVSDNQSTSQKGGSNSDTRSHSSSLITCQDQNAPKRRHTFEKLETNDSSSSRTETNQFCNVVVQEPWTMVAPLSIPHQSNPSSSTEKSKADTHRKGNTKETSNGLNGTPPKQPNKNFNVAPVSGIPCVWTTGNGPKGKTITGFLYKYDKSEVSIMCVCHGTSFSPAGFVEHAGGVDVLHPLRHITVVPSSSGL